MGRIRPPVFPSALIANGRIVASRPLDMECSVKHAAVLLSLVILLIGLSPAQAAPSHMTRRTLLLGLARSAGAVVDPGAPPEVQEAQAARVLGRIGIRIEGSLDETVTELDLVEAGKAVGARVKSSDPDRKVTKGKGSGFILSLTDNIHAAMGRQNDEVRVNCRGLLSRFGRKGIPASPADPNATAPPCP